MHKPCCADLEVDVLLEQDAGLGGLGFRVGGGAVVQTVLAVVYLGPELQKGKQGGVVVGLRTEGEARTFVTAVTIGLP